MAGTKVAELVASLRLDAKNFSSALKESESKLTKFGTSAQKAGTKMTMALTLPIAGAAAGAIKAASDFETSMTKIQSMVGLSAETVKGFEKDVLRLAGETAQAPKELADAMFFITSAGLRGATAVQALEASAKAAAIGMGDAEVIADAVTNAINGYGAANITAAEATDILAKTVEQGKASAEDLAPQFGRLIPMAAELGISFDQVGGGLAFLTRASGNASQSTSSLRGILRTLIKPSQMARQTLEDVGLSVEDLRSAADDDLLGALINMRDTLEANGKEMGAVFEDSEALAGALQLTGTAAAEAAGVMDEMTRSAGTLDRGMAAVSETSGFQMAQAMTALKIVMIDLGQKLIPIVVPLIQKLAAFIKDLADKFNNLSPFMQKMVIALAGIAAAAGPALIGIGSVARGLGSLKKVGDGVTGMITGGGGMAQGIGTLAAKLGMATGGLGFAAVGAAAIIGGGLFLALKANREEAQRDQDRMKLLREEMIDTGEASLILTTDVDELTERLKALADAAKDGEEEIEQFNGRMVLMQELMGRDAKAVFDTYITDMEHHNEMTAAGSDSYQDLAGSLNIMKSQLESNIRKIENHRDVLGEDTDQVIEALRNGDLSILQLKNILTALDKTADAYDDDRKAQEKSAEQYFKSAENVLAYEDALTAGQLAVVNAALAEGNHAEALENVIAYTRSLEAREERLTARTEALAVAQEQAAGTANRLRDAGLGVAAAAEEETARTWDDVLAHREANVVRLRTIGFVTMLTSGMTEAAEAAAAEAAEVRGVAQAYSDAGDAKLYSMGADFKSGRETAREATYRKGVADAAQAVIDAENERIRLLQEQADLERDALRLANDLRDAHQDVADTVRDIADAERDRDEAISDQLRIKEEIDALDARGVEIGDRQLAIVDEIAAVTAEITALDAERAKYALDNTEFAASLAHNLNKAKLATITLADKVAELEGTRDAVVDVTSAEANVAALQAQQAAINDVEQALIDMNLISGEDAGLMDLTVREAKTLQRLEAQLRKVEQEYEDGEVDVLALMSATQDYDRAMAEARSGSDELRAAQRALNEVRTEAAVLQKEQENISLKLAIATEDLRLAKLAEAEATDFESARTKELNRIRVIEAGLEDDLLKLGEESAALDTERAQITKALTDAEEEKTAALARQTEAQSALEAATQQQEYAQVRLQRVQDEVNAAQSAQNKLWEELADLIYDAGGAFADLKDKINDVATAASSASGTTGGAGGGATGGGKINFAGPSQGGIGLETEWLNTLSEQPKEYRDWFSDIQKSSHYAGQDADGKNAILNAVNEAALGVGAFSAGKVGAADGAKILDDMFGIKSAAKGGFVKSAGLVNVHAGETITPGGGTTYITVNVEGSVASERDLVESIRKGLLRSQQAGRAVVL